MKLLKQFSLDICWLPCALGFVYYINRDLGSVFSAITLAILEISLSFDNSVVNAKKLELMNKFWRMMFLTLGMVIAVGVVRFYLPLQLVSTMGDVSITKAFHMALHDHQQFQTIIASSHDLVAAFGAGFLGLLGITFFVDKDREVTWCSPIEKPLMKLAEKISPDLLSIVVILLLGALMAHLKQNVNILYCDFAGVVVYYVMEFIKTALEKADESLSSGKFKFLSGGFGIFLFLEVLDASMSMDGVVAAISISGDIVVVAAGLSIGALAIRSLTIKLVDDGTLKDMQYIESGAFWSIFLVAMSMFVGMFVALPEWLMGAVSAVLIICSGAQSFIGKKPELA